jgi:phosphoribosyl 1,2-cyclic phosphate phosphodiesterase
LVRLNQLGDGDVVKFNGYHIRPIRLAEEYVYAFLVEGEGKRLLVMMDELFGWEPSADLMDVDLAVMPMGLTEFNPLTGERHIPADHPVLQHEATFLQTLDIIRKLKPRRVILTHIEEPDRLSHDDLQYLAERLRTQGLNIDFAHDTWRVEV